MTHSPRGGLGPLVFFAVGATGGFAAVFFGLPLLGAIEEGPAVRIGVALVAALFVGTVAAIIARGRDVAAIADAALVGESSSVLLAHRARRVRARFAGLGSAAVAAVATYLALGQLYASVNERRYEWNQLELGPQELGLAGLFGLLLGFIVWRVLHPGRLVEDDEEPRVGDGLSTVSDEELEATARAVRAHQTRSALARAAGFVSAAGAMIGLAYGVMTFEVDGGASLWVLIFGLGIAAGVVVNRALGPRIDIEDLGAPPVELPTGEGVTPPTFDERIRTASSFQVTRRSGLLRLLMLEGGRSYGLAADDIALAEGEETQTLLGRLLPALLDPFRAEIRDEGRILTVEGALFAPRFVVVGADGAPIGIIEGAILGRRYVVRAGESTLTLTGSFWNRKELALLEDGQRVGYVQVTTSRNALESFLSGSEVRLHLELPASTGESMRRALLAALLVVDHRHF